MQTASEFNIHLWAEHFPQLVTNQTLKSITTQEFADLGAEAIVYAQQISAAELKLLFADAMSEVPEGNLTLLMSAAGVPLLVTDNDQAIGDWLEQHEVTLVQRH
jgi:hypothetical protein